MLHTPSPPWHMPYAIPHTLPRATTHPLQALLWFRSPPRYFARCTRQAAYEQLAALEAFMHQVDKTIEMGLGTPGGNKSASSWPSYKPATAYAAAGTGRGYQAWNDRWWVRGCCRHMCFLRGRRKCVDCTTYLILVLIPGMFLA